MMHPACMAALHAFLAGWHTAVASRAGRKGAHNEGGDVGEQTLLWLGDGEIFGQYWVLDDSWIIKLRRQRQQLACNKGSARQQAAACSRVTAWVARHGRAWHKNAGGQEEGLLVATPFLAVVGRRGEGYSPQRAWLPGRAWNVHGALRPTDVHCGSGMGPAQQAAGVHGSSG